MKRLKRPSYLTRLLTALPVLSLLALGTAPAQATSISPAAPSWAARTLRR